MSPDLVRKPDPDYMTNNDYNYDFTCKCKNPTFKIKDITQPSCYGKKYYFICTKCSRVYEAGYCE